MPQYQSDLIADLIKQYGFPYIALNPGASYRGLHDSLVNHNNDDPPMMLCQHEKIAVQIAHGYAKHSRKPMVAIVHDVVGMLHSVMGIYYAYLDRVPVFVIGATGPMDEGKRRPFIDWIHTAQVQGEAVRYFTKWDYQPSGVEGFPDSFARAYSIMMSEPQGPTYMCYDAWLQEAELTKKIELPDPKSAKVPSRIAPDPAALDEAADRLLTATWPVLMAEFAGRTVTGFDDMVNLAETIGAPVWDVGIRLNFPNRHPLNLTEEPEVFRRADLICGLDLRDWEKPTTFLNRATRETTTHYKDGTQWMKIGFEDLDISRWSTDYGPFPDCAQRVLADTALAIPALAERCRARIAKDAALQKRIGERKGAVKELHDKLHDRWLEASKKDWDNSPFALPRLALEVWDKIKNEDWVLTAGTLEDWALRLWDFDKWYRHAGKSLGTGTQIGTSLGVALANKGTGRLVVDFQPDGDLMFDAGALWTAARYEIPILVVMYNNRAYYNDWEHQIRVAEKRGTPVERAYIGMDLGSPEPDFATLAKSMGWYAEGPIDKPADVGAALTRAIAQVKKGKPALLDTITRHR
jgi:acetolactate synthase I/II/III large subunit